MEDKKGETELSTSDFSWRDTCSLVNSWAMVLVVDGVCQTGLSVSFCGEAGTPPSLVG